MTIVAAGGGTATIAGGATIAAGQLDVVDGATLQMACNFSASNSTFYVGTGNTAPATLIVSAGAITRSAVGRPPPTPST